MSLARLSNLWARSAEDIVAIEVITHVFFLIFIQVDVRMTAAIPTPRWMEITRFCIITECRIQNQGRIQDFEGGLIEKNMGDNPRFCFCNFDQCWGRLVLEKVWQDPPNPWIN